MIETVIVRHVGPATQEHLGEYAPDFCTGEDVDHDVVEDATAGTQYRRSP